MLIGPERDTVQAMNGDADKGDLSDPDQAVAAAGKPIASICHGPWRWVVTSRNPDDLDAFCATLVETFAKV